jgi:hypothetical protein
MVGIYIYIYAGLNIFARLFFFFFSFFFFFFQSIDLPQVEPAVSPQSKPVLPARRGCDRRGCGRMGVRAAANGAGAGRRLFTLIYDYFLHFRTATARRLAVAGGDTASDVRARKACRVYGYCGGY